jgi:hypothetical protein
MFSSRLIVADVRRQLESMATTPDLFLPELNQVVERYIDLLLDKAFYEEVDFGNGTTTGFFTLPRQFDSCMGVVGNNFSVASYSEFHQYRELGVGYQVPTQMTMPGIMDMGDGWVTQGIITTPGVLRITVGPDDANKVVRLGGLDDNNLEIFNPSVPGAKGIGIVTVFPFVDTTVEFSSLLRVMTDNIFEDYWTISVVNGSTVTQIAQYAPGEQRPNYRRYKTGMVDPNMTIRMLCRRRYVPLVHETDWVTPDHIGALKMGLQALNMEQGERQDLAANNWASGFTMLQNRMKSFRGSSKTAFNSPFNTSLALPQQTR